MRDRTFINIPSKSPKIAYNSHVFSLGSCFSAHISDRLTALKYSIVQNPCGITFNPSSILTAIKRTLSPESLLSSELNYHKGLYSHPDFHGSFNNPDQVRYLENAKNSLLKAKKGLKMTQFVFITIGTSFVYRSIKSREIVNNCHKLPATDFSKELLVVHEVVELLEEARKIILSNTTNESVQFIMTVSPVRHTKNGLVEDRKSKAIALLAVHDLVEQYENCHYFPAYELMVDDLRDYRYYQSDLIHPSSVAIDYIFDHFEKSWLDHSEAELRTRIAGINKRLAHRPLFPDTDEHLQFKNKILTDQNLLEESYPFLKGKF